MSVLTIENLSLKNKSGNILVDNFSMRLERGETVGLVGESGSGKTLTMRSVIGLLPEGISETCDLKRVDGACAMIFQNPMSALDPLYPVFKQLKEIVRLRQKVNRAEAGKIAENLWKKLSLPCDVPKKDRYPAAFSGGQLQRIMIAIALACKPDILLCDEPTTALDVTVQKQTIELIKELQRELNFAMIFVTHNLAVAANMCESLYVMQKGRIVETGKTTDILESPTTPYTQKLISSVLTVPGGK